MPAPDGGDDFVGIGDPLEGLGLGVVVFEEPVDRRLEVDDGSEDAALPAGEATKNTIIQPMVWVAAERRSRSKATPTAIKSRPESA